ncbi:MAG: hypothetical protein O3A84_07565 [Proteobacteria bacterium]|nr:hypothetical protein [Pseudomonadota bacterium]
MIDRKETGNSFNLKRLQDLLDARGADIASWPGADRSWVERLTEQEPMASVILERAKRLNEIIGQAPTIAASPALRDRILAAADKSARENVISIWRIIWPFGPIWRPAAALAFSAAFGIYVGVADPIMMFGAQDQQVAQPVVIADEMVVIVAYRDLGLEETQ